MAECEDPFHGRDGFNDVQFDERPDVGRIREEHAVDVIRRIVKENPGGKKH